jgi:hypothetical protein
MAGNGGRAREKGFGRLTRAGLSFLASEGFNPFLLKHMPAVLPEHPFSRLPCNRSP